jgi:hypothetical protein
MSIWNSGDYARASALVVHATLVKSIEASFSTLPIADQDAILIDILDRVARRCGWEIRRVYVEAEDD